MKKKTNLKILKFPGNVTESERKVEAILFSAEEPLDISSIEDKLKAKTDIKKILNSLEMQYRNRGINLVCITGKWSFRTASNLSKFMNVQTFAKKKTF